jgi:hypothetical protein
MVPFIWGVYTKADGQRISQQLGRQVDKVRSWFVIHRKGKTALVEEETPAATAPSTNAPSASAPVNLITAAQNLILAELDRLAQQQQLQLDPAFVAEHGLDRRLVDGFTDLHAWRLDRTNVVSLEMEHLRYPSLKHGRTLDFSFTFSTSAASSASFFVSHPSTALVSSHHTNLPLSSIPLPLNVTPIPSPQLPDFNPSATQVLRNIYHQLTAAENALLQPVLDTMLSVPRTGERFNQPTFANDGDIYPMLGTTMQQIWSTLLAREQSHRKLKTLPTDMVAPSSSFRSALLVMAHYPPDCMVGSTIYRPFSPSIG